MKTFDINGSTVELLAAGHNAKKPMLLVSTASDLLPGEPQRKEWITYDEGGAKVRTRRRSRTYTRSTAGTSTSWTITTSCGRAQRQWLTCGTRSNGGTVTLPSRSAFGRSMSSRRSSTSILAATPGVSPPACARAADGRPAARDRRGQRACGVTDGDDRRGPPVVQLCQAGFR